MMQALSPGRAAWRRPPLPLLLLLLAYAACSCGARLLTSTSSADPQSAGATAAAAACAGAAAVGDVCNACPHPVAFRAAYQLLTEYEDDPFATVDYATNCSQILRAIPGTTAHLWLCLAPWAQLAPGATLHLPLDAPVPGWVPERNASVQLWWQYTAHAANADGSAFSLTRGALGSQLLRVVPLEEQMAAATFGMPEERTPCYPPSAPNCTWWTRVPPVVRSPPDWDGADSPTTALILRCPDFPGPAANATPGWLPRDVAPLAVRSECAEAVSFAAAFPLDGGEHACTQEEGMGGPQAPDHGSGICVSPRVALQPGQTAVVDATRAGPGGGLPAGAWFSAHVVPQIPPNSTEYIPAPIRYWLSALPGSRCFWPGMEWADATVAQATAEAFYVWAPLPQAGGEGAPTVAVEPDSTIVLRCPHKHTTGSDFAKLCPQR